MKILEGTVYGEPYKYVCPPVNPELVTWVHEQFGPVGGTLIGQRWYFNDFHLWFRDDEDLTLFLLRWT